MSWREAWRLSGVAFTELSFQAIYALRQGNLAPTTPPKDLVGRARRRVLQSKVLISFVLVFVTLGATLLLRYPDTLLARSMVPPALYITGVVAGVLVFEIALLWWTGVQVIPTYITSGVLPVLESLPIDDRTLGQTALLLYLKLFDLPLFTCAILTPLAVGLALGSPLAGLATVPGVVAALVFALFLALITGRFFVARIEGSRGGGGPAALRWLYLMVWAVPALAMYGFLAAAPGFLIALGTLANHGPLVYLETLLAVFPFSLATLPALVVDGTGGLAVPTLGLALVLVAAVLYGAATVAEAQWLRFAPRRLGWPAPVTAGGSTAQTVIRLRPRSSTAAILLKDLRTASRVPGYAFLIILPIFDAAALGLFTLLSNPPPDTAFNLGAAAVTTAALLATFFGPAFFAIEVMGYSYGRTLPLPDRSILVSKVSLVAVIYSISAVAVILLTLVKVFEPAIFIGFLVAEFPAVIAAALLELGILFRRAQTSGMPIVNLYAGAWWAVLVAVPGLILAGLPLVTFQLLRSSSASLAVVAMGFLALTELAASGAFALVITGRGPG